MNRHILIILCAVLLLGNVSNALGGGFMFRKWSADQLAEAEAIVTSQTIAGMILTGQQKFEDAPTSTNPREIYLVVRVRALSNQTIWGELACMVGQRFTVTVPVTHIGGNTGWCYFIFTLRGSIIDQPTVIVKWKSIFAK